VSAKVSIVILNWNGAKYLEQFLPSVLKGGFSDKEIIVADNASTDGSVSFLQLRYPQVKIIVLEKNYGFAEGYNEALKQVKSDYYILLNSDVEVTTNWIDPLFEMMEKNRVIAACQPKVLNYYNKEMFEYAGAAGGWIDYLGYPFARGRVFDHCETDFGQYDKEEAIFWASGAALFVRAEAFHEMNGFDNYFFAHMEEIDLCWRFQLAGYQVFACPGSVVYHVGGATLAKENSQKIFLNFRNNLIMLAKNLPLSQSAWKIPFRLFLDTLSAFKNLISGKRGYFVATIKAQIAFIKWVLFNQKCSVFPKNKRGSLKGWFKGSIVWGYFVSGKRTFAQIVKNKS
jgi:GT2 family glycosyltransferase